MDTGWESDRTYEYIDQVQKDVGEIITIKNQVDISGYPKIAQDMIKDLEEMIGFESPFIRLVFSNHCFPNHFQKWCTRELKIRVFKGFCDAQDGDMINIVGVRRSESKRRANVEEWEWNSNFDCWTWRPLYLWQDADVIDIHKRFGLVPNGLYLNGHNRVGCYPCIYFGKRDLKHISQKRINVIERFERYLGDFLIAQSKNKKVLAHLENAKSTHGYIYRSFFKSKNLKHEPITKVIEWAKTSRGGKQLELFDTNVPTCHKWGLCGI